MKRDFHQSTRANTTDASWERETRFLIPPSRDEANHPLEVVQSPFSLDYFLLFLSSVFPATDTGILPLPLPEILASSSIPGQRHWHPPLPQSSQIFFIFLESIVSTLGHPTIKQTFTHARIRRAWHRRTWPLTLRRFRVTLIRRTTSCLPTKFYRLFFAAFDRNRIGQSYTSCHRVFTNCAPLLLQPPRNPLSPASSVAWTIF